MDKSDGQSTQNSKPYPDLKEEGNLLVSLVSHWTHEDNLFWVQVRYLLTLQLALYAAWFGLGTSVLAVIVMYTSALFSYLLYRLAKTIRINRDVNIPVIKIVSKSMATNQTTEHLEALKNYDYANWGVMRLAEHSLTKSEDAGKHFQWRIFIFCIAINLIIGSIGVHDLICKDDRWPRHLNPRFEIQQSISATSQNQNTNSLTKQD